MYNTKVQYNRTTYVQFFKFCLLLSISILKIVVKTLLTIIVQDDSNSLKKTGATGCNQYDEFLEKR